MDGLKEAIKAVKAGVAEYPLRPTKPRTNTRINVRNERCLYGWDQILDWFAREFKASTTKQTLRKKAYNEGLPLRKSSGKVQLNVDEYYEWTKTAPRLKPKKKK